MQVYRCPVCGNQTVTWDARAGVFLCNVMGCNSSFSPPSPENTTTEDSSTAYSHGRLVVVQSWIDGQRDSARRTATATSSGCMFRFS